MTTAQLDVWPDRFLWASWNYKGSMTHRYAANVVMAAQSRKLILQQADRRAADRCSVALCAVGASRHIDATEIPFLSLNLDPDSATALRLRGAVGDRSVRLLKDDLATPFSERIVDFLEGRLDARQSRLLGDDIVSAIVPDEHPWPVLDARIGKIAYHLRTELPSQIDASALAKEVALSPGRLMHLFRAQLGLSMGNFLLWQKMRHALSMILQDVSLTSVAQACGFSDSSHLTHTFQEFYAVRPSDLRNSSYVQVRLLQA
jgi:AraC-like DNA-binding protein